MSDATAAPVRGKFVAGGLMFPLAMLMTALAGPTGVVWANAMANVLTGSAAAWFAWRYIVRLRAGAPSA